MVENIPLNGRKFQDLSLLVPGTRPSNYYDPTKTEVGGISYGGATGRSVIINVDGGDNNDGVVRGLLQQFSNDAIQEYKVTTQRYSAEYGRSVGGVVNVITKSGTNEFHGGAFLFARNQKLNARTHFEELTNAPKPDFSQQQFGATLGGPIQKDKAHFFVAYERNRRNQTDTIFTNGVLPDEEGPIEKPFRNHLLTAKLNFQVNEANSMIVRYALEDQGRKNDFTGGNAISTVAATNTNKIHSAIAKNTTVFGASKVNELTVMWQHFENNILADHPERPGDRHARLHRRRQHEHAAADHPAPLPVPRRLLLPQGGLGRRPQLQGGGRGAALPLRGLLHPDPLRVLHLQQPDPGGPQRRRLRERHR